MAKKHALVQLVETLGKTDLPTEQSLKEYDPLQHEVFNQSKRKKRKKIVPTGEKKIIGEGAGAKEVDVTKTVYEEVNRISIPFQKLIVRRRAAFMNCGRMNILSKPANDNEENLLAMVKKCRDDNKMEFKLTEIAERMMSELQVAELWYSEDTDKSYWGDLASNATKRMRVKILSPELGDQLFPVFSPSGELVYFARGYKSKKDLLAGFDENSDEALSPISDQDVKHLDIYTSEKIFKFEMASGIWDLKDVIPHSYGKLPIVYYSQDKPEWNDVQPLIERLETLVSNFADVVDANSSPVLFAKGIIKSMPARGEVAKVINVVPQIDRDGKEVGSSDLKYLTWDAAPEAVRLEIDNLINFIYTCTQTPDISSKGMAELGVKSGTGFDRVFVDAHLGAMRHTNGHFGECVQRSLNFLKSACVAINTGLKSAERLELAPDFPLFRINDESETIDMLLQATGGESLLSQKTAVGMTGLVQDADKEYEQIQKERDTLGREIENLGTGKEDE